MLLTLNLWQTTDTGAGTNPTAEEDTDTSVHIISTAAGTCRLLYY